MKKITLLLLSVITCIHLTHAQKLPSTLLWKISGNGLHKSSYLFGTMHLTDERIFNIGDSVYNAIENSEGFAIEIDPAEFTPLVIDEARKSITKARRLKEIMNESEFKKYGKALAKKLNKDEDEITTADVLREKNKWIQESYRTGKMQTFLDAYLFDVARRQGKWTGGVEDLEDQEGTLDYLIDESDIEELAVNEGGKNNQNNYNEAAEKFILTYIKNDLNAIDSISNLGDSLRADALLDKRNKKMAVRMDSLSHIRSMVFAVGAAHLPGNAGLISLLQQKGFTVEPVLSSKKIKPKDYKITSIELPWYGIKDEEGFYADSMPGKPENLTMYGLLTMKMYFDVFTSTLYMTTGLNTPYSQNKADSIFGKLASYYFSTNDYKKGKPIVVNSVSGREFSSSKDNFSHGYFLFNNGMMYIAIGVSMRKDTSATASINRFLHSFTILESNTGNSGKSFTYINNKKAYKIDLPAEPKLYNEISGLSTDSSLKRELHVVSDPQSGAYLFVGINQASEGYFIKNDSTALAGIRESQKEKYKAISIDTMYRKHKHWVLEFGGINAQTSLTMKTYYESRGSKWYALVAIYDATKAHESVDHFFKSFTILDYPVYEWKNYTSEDKMFTAWAPLEFKYTENYSESEKDTIHKYESYDSSRGDNYGVVVRKFPKYYWQNSDSALWEEVIQNHTSDADTVFSKKAISNGEIKGYELLTQKEGSNNVQRERILLSNNKTYSLITVQAASEIYNDNNNKFFESFRFTYANPNTELFVSNAAALITDISSGDSLIRNTAKDFLSQAHFTNKELPLLHNALLKTYATDEEDAADTKERLENIIIGLNDTSSYNFAKNNYASADDTTKNILLEIMASLHTQKNYDEIKTILLRQPPHITPGYNFISTFTDSLQLTGNIFPALLPLLSDTIMAPFIIRVSEKIIDSNLATATMLQPYEQNILQFSQSQYRHLKNDPDDYDYSTYSLIHILGKINNASCNAMLQRWSLIKAPYLQLDAVSMLLQNKQTLNTSALQDIAADKSSRTQLYDTLKAYKKEILFPKQYLTQKYFAESYAYTVASDDYEPSDLTYITQKIINFKGRQSRFFFYKVTYNEDEDKTYTLACAGPFDVNTANISAEHAYADIYTDEDFDQSNFPAQMDALIKQMEDWYGWKDEKK